MCPVNQAVSCEIVKQLHPIAGIFSSLSPKPESSRKKKMHTGTSSFIPQLSAYFFTTPATVASSEDSFPIFMDPRVKKYLSNVILHEGGKATDGTSQILVKMV